MVPFSPAAGATVNIDVAATTANVQITPGTGLVQIRVMNNGSATAWIAFGGSSITATLAANIPVGPGVTEVLSFNAPSGGLYAAAIAAGSTGKIYFTPGSGI